MKRIVMQHQIKYELEENLNKYYDSLDRSSWGVKRILHNILNIQIVDIL